MGYSTTYTDENGVSRAVSISDADSREAIKNDYAEIMKRYHPDRVRIQRIQTKPGEELHLRVTTLAPSHYLESSTDTNPKACDSMAVDIIVYLGYPLKAVSACYPANHYLASPNVYPSGRCCINTWIPYVSSLLTVVEKLVMDMIHWKEVTIYSPPANASMVKWHKDGVAEGRFPTIQPKLLRRLAPRALPVSKPRTAAPVPRPLPTRR